jgi:hypothetical protein
VQKHATQRSARSASDDQVTIRARSTDDGKKAHAKKHGKKNGKANGKKGHKQRRHGR